MISEHASFGVGCHEDGANGFDPGGIGWHELLPETALPCLHIKSIDSRWQFSWLINVEGTAVRAPGDRLLSGVESRNNAGLATRKRIEVPLVVRTDPSHPLRVGGHDKCGAIHAFRRNRLALARSRLVDI